MSDDSDTPSGGDGPTQKLERPSFDDFDDQEGTQEVDTSQIELIEDSAIEPVEPPDKTLERESRPSDPGESTQVLERDGLQKATEQDEYDGRPPGERSTEQMSAVDDTTTKVVMDPPESPEDTTSAFKVPEELLREASAAHEAASAADNNTTQQMEPVTERTVEFDGSVDEWAEVDDHGVIRCVATVDEQGRLIVPRSLLDDVLDEGMKLIIEAQPMHIDE
jgi:hypothetical protein